MTHKDYIPPTGFGINPLYVKKKPTFKELLGQHLLEEDVVDHDEMEDNLSSTTT